jgi:hypothetical protein
MATNTNGHVLPAAFASPGTPYYAQAQGVIAQPTLLQPTIVAPITLQGVATEGTLAVPAQITVPGTTHADPDYVGAIKLVPGGNPDAVDGSAGIVVRATASESPSIAAGTTLEVGTDSESPNRILVAGVDGLSEVYNELYNQPVQLQTITIVASNPLCAPSAPGAEVFRCTQTGVDAADAGPFVFNRIQVPRSGAYMLQSEIRMGNDSGEPNTVVLPSTLVGGVPIWNGIQIAMQEFGTVNVVPYSVNEIIGGDFQAIDTFESGGFTTKTYSVIVVLDATKVYTVGIVTNSNLWNIGSAGQIKVELIAMC